MWRSGSRVIEGCSGKASLLAAGTLLLGACEEGAKLAKVRPDHESIFSALRTYKISAGDYPTTEQGLQAMVERPSDLPPSAGWVQLATRVPTDPWKNPYDYENLTDSRGRTELILRSLGPDGIQSDDDKVFRLTPP